MSFDGPDERFSVGEEIAHSLTHGIGALLGIAALVLLVVFAVQRGTAIHVVSASIYGGTLVLLYLSSTLYHALPVGTAKRVFGVFDHAAIFLLIAGTYTPYTLITLSGGLGWTMFGIVWGLALLGVVLEAVTVGRARRLQLVLYLVMGWMVVGAVRPLISELATGGLVLLIAGGVCYTLGVVFYVRHTMRWHHAIWHLFVLAGSACHVFSVMFFVLP